MKFNPKYFAVTVAIFIIEVLIATLFKNIAFVRAYLGDVLVVILIYTFICSFYEVKDKNKIIFYIFIFVCLVEFTQYFHFGEILGLKEHKIAMIILGNSFSWIDIWCYFAGSLIIYFFQNFFIQKFTPKN